MNRAAGLLLAAGLVQLLQPGLVMEIGAADPWVFVTAAAVSSLATICGVVPAGAPRASRSPFGRAEAQ